MRATFKNALKDPKVEIDVIAPSRAQNIARLLHDLGSDCYVSEWRHTLGEVRYEYHRHNKDVGLVLKQLYDQGIRGGNPTLTRVYSRADLEQVIQEPTASSS